MKTRGSYRLKEHKSLLSQATKRKLARARKRQAEREEAINIIQSLRIQVPKIKLATLRDIAIKKMKENFRAINAEGEPDLSEDNIKDAMVHHLAHLSWPELPPTLKIDPYGTVFGPLNARIYALIAEKYPSLKLFCVES